MSDTTEPEPAELTSLPGAPLPDELTQSDPALLVDSVRGSGQPQRNVSDAHEDHTNRG